MALKKRKVAKKQIGVGDVYISPTAKKYVNEILSSRRLTYGRFSQQFEKEFSSIHDLKFSLFCNSGTSALQVALHALKEKYGWQDGDEVLVPALTFVATVNIILQNNLKPVFVDIDPLYFCIDPSKIEKAITKKTRAIIPVHIGGQPADMDPIMKIARKHNLKIVEDSCETMFARYNGKRVGTFGDISCFSTYAAHIIVTGVGGFVSTNSPELAVLSKSLLNHGRDGIYISIDDDKVSKKEELFNIVSRRFNFTDVGYSYRATEFEAALGVAQLANWEEGIQKRKENASYLTDGLKDLLDDLQLPHIRPGSEHVFMFYPIILKNKKVTREKLVFYLEEQGIETRYLLPLLNQPVYKKLFGDIENKYPVAKHISENGFYVGSHPQLKKSELDFIIHTMHDFFKNEA